MKTLVKITPLDFVVRFPDGGTQDRHGNWKPIKKEIEYDVFGSQPTDIQIKDLDLSGLKIVNTEFRHRIGGRFVKVLYARNYSQVSEVVIKPTYGNEVHIYLIMPQ